MHSKPYVLRSRTAGQNFPAPRLLVWVQGGENDLAVPIACRMNVSGLRALPEQFQKRNGAKEAGVVLFINGLRLDPPRGPGTTC